MGWARLAVDWPRCAATFSEYSAVVAGVPQCNAQTASHAQATAGGITKRWRNPLAMSNAALSFGAVGTRLHHIHASSHAQATVSEVAKPPHQYLATTQTKATADRIETRRHNTDTVAHSAHPSIRLVVCGGGTMGHVYPALAVLERIRIDASVIDSDATVWVGSRRGVERAAVSSLMRYVSIPCGKLRRYFSWRTLIDGWLVLCGVFASLLFLMRHRQAVVFSKGGYVSVPVVVAARLLKMRVVSHESDLSPGLATTINAWCSQRICVLHSDSTRYYHQRLRTKIAVTGNPIRTAVMNGDREKGRNAIGATNQTTVLFFIGGSLGASQINDLLQLIVDSLLQHSTIMILHQYGRNNRPLSFPDVPPHHYRDRYRAYPYLDTELFDCIAAADIVISRAGASAVCEFASVGKPMILIPLSTGASRGEQVLMAQFMQQHHAALALPNPQPQQLYNAIDTLRTNHGKRAALHRNAMSLFASNGAHNVAQIIEQQLTAVGATSGGMTR